VEDGDAIQFNANMKCFLVRGSDGETVRVVKVYPRPSCSCRPVGLCYHILAVQRSIGFVSATKKKCKNLTLLRKTKRQTKQKPGKKIARVGDYDVIAAPDASDGSVESEDEITGQKVVGRWSICDTLRYSYVEREK